jgi:A/G-specific adenine glycosylase
MKRRRAPRTAPARRRAFQRRLLAWYGRHRRDLPWRRTRDPYHILVSEMMLQQTQVGRVIPKYEEWLARYPSLQALAEAGRREVREAWYPLGYNARPLRLRDIARAVVSRYRGRIPATREELLALKGIGPYTAGAVLSFAHRQDAPVLDTNVRRVLRRVFLGEGAAPPDRRLWELAEQLLPRGSAYDFNQALMDFGATVCTARKPGCPACALATLCASYPVAAPNAAAPGRVRSKSHDVKAVVHEQDLTRDPSGQRAAQKHRRVRDLRRIRVPAQRRARLHHL